MKMTKADYDELVELRDRGFTDIKHTASGLNVAATSAIDEGSMYFTLCRVDVPHDGEPHNIAAAIAEYEREQEGK